MVVFPCTFILRGLYVVSLVYAHFFSGQFKVRQQAAATLQLLGVDIYRPHVPVLAS